MGVRNALHVSKKQVHELIPIVVDSLHPRVMDNDWSNTGFIPYLIALNANMTVLGLTGNTADSGHYSAPFMR